VIKTNPPDFRLRPSRRIHREKTGKRITAPLVRLLKTQARAIRRAARATKSHGGGKPRPAFSQRCAVRVSYSTNRPGITGKKATQWKAHGKYLERDSAVRAPGEPTGLRRDSGFDATREGLPIASTLDLWQGEQDVRLWKIIISPEHPCDLVALTRKTMAGMEHELGQLEWVAIIHRNTDHHHAHVALRGRDEYHNPLMIPADMIRSGIRAIAEAEVTRQLGYRTREQALAARAKEVTARRFTGLDRMLLGSRHDITVNQVDLSRHSNEHAPMLLERLNLLRSFGLAGVQGRNCEFCTLAY
jgi:hypothetical protein